MRPWRCTRVFILLFLIVSVFIPIILLSHRLKYDNSYVSKEFVEDLSIMDKAELLNEPSREVYKDVGFNSQVLVISSDEENRSIESGNVSRSSDEESRGSESRNSLSTSNEENESIETGDILHSSDKKNSSGSVKALSLPDKEKSSESGNELIAFDEDTSRLSGNALSVSDGENISSESEKAAEDVNLSKRKGTSNDKGDRPNKTEADLHTLQKRKHPVPEKKEQTRPTTKAQHNQGSQRDASDEKVKEMKDQILRATVYLNFLPPGSNSHIAKELRLRIREVERVLGGSIKDSDLPRRSFQKMNAMEATLAKASHIYPDCEAMSTNLHAMTYNTEEQVRRQKEQTAFLFHLAGRTTPKGLHCLSMRLTSEFFVLLPDDRELPNQHKLNDQSLYHFGVFSDNVLACAVVVNSTVSAAEVPEKIVFHIVTDSLNLPAMTMWFLLNAPEKATVHVQSTDNFGWLSEKYEASLLKEASLDLQFTFSFYHLRFYLPDVFPRLNKIVLLDHDVVVRRDLMELWEVNMKGKVNGAVETCQEGEPSYLRMDTFINFTDLRISKTFYANTCTWAFGMNIFDLQEWRKQDLTQVYHKYLAMESKWSLTEAGTLPLGWMTFYKQTVALDRRFHALGLGRDRGVKPDDIEQASVIHFNGIMKPWLDIGIDKYKRYWKKYVNYQHPYVQQCNIQE